MISRLSTESNITNGSISAKRKWFDGSSAAHWHDFYEIEYVISGTGSYNINGQVFEIRGGMLYLMTPADFHEVKAEHMEVINVMFSENLVTSAFLVPFTYYAAPKTLTIPERMQPFLLTLLEEVVQCQEDLIYASALLDCLLIKLAGNLPDYDEESWNSTAQKIHFYIINHFREKIGLEDVGQYVGLTPAYVSAIFKKEMNKNFKKYLNELRFAYARKMLLYTDMSVTQICGESGFDDYPNFIRRFKEFFGVTPTQMRNKQRSLDSLADFTAQEGVRDTTDIMEKYRKGALGALPDPELIHSLLDMKGNKEEPR